MKQLFLALLLLVHIPGLMAQNADDIFTFSADGSILNKPTIYNTTPFYWDEGVLKVKDYSTTTVQTKDKTIYTVNLQRDINEKAPYYFQIIQIKHNNKLIFEVKNDDYWFNAQYTNGSTHQYEVIPLSETASAILFFGKGYDSTPPLLTIVIVNRGKAKLVFNQNCDILKYTHTANEFSLIYTDQIQEIPYDGAQPEPADYQLAKFKIWKSGEILKFQRIQ